MQTENSGIENLQNNNINHGYVLIHGIMLFCREGKIPSGRKQLGKVKAVHHIGGRAAGTIDDFIHGRQGALWMTSSMDATEGGKQSVLVLVTWSSSKAKSKLWAHANEKNQRIEIDKTTA